MKAIKLIAALLGFGFVGSVMAANPNQATVTVTGNVAAACKMVSASGSVTFTLDPTTTGSGSAPSAHTDPTFWCTNGATISVASTGANDVTGQKYLVNGTNKIAYAFSATPSQGTGGGAATTITLAVGGSVADAAFATSPAGAYTDTVTVTVTSAP